MAITSASAPDAAPRKQTLSGNYIDFTGAGSRVGTTILTRSYGKRS
jgi:hypothetical protein